MTHPFVELQSEYQSQLARMVVTRQREVDQVSDRLLGFVRQGRYAAVSEQLGIPQVFIATSFERESSSDFRCSPAQGDPYDKVSTHVPRGRGPFPDWKSAAIDAYKLDHLDQVTDWTWARFCYEGELFNGFGYRQHGVASPYDWAGSNDYSVGRYVADGVWSSTSVDTQLGIVPVARAMATKMPSLDLAGWPGAAVPTVGLGPVPAGVGGALPARGALTGTHWLQDSLNKLMLPTGDHLVVDGSYGRHTRRAVAMFQEFVGNTVDGLVGDQTCAAIDAALLKITQPGR